MNTKSHVEKMYPARFVILAFILYFVLFILPSLISFIFAFTDWNSNDLNNPVFIGLENFRNIFISNDIVLGIKNTLLFTTVTTILRSVLGLLVALTVNRKTFRLKGYLRTVIYIPGILSMVVIGVMFINMLHPQGLVNTVLKLAGLDFLASDWLNDIKISMYTICAVDVWRSIGFTMIIYLAGLQSIQQSYYESAMIDGANAMQRFFKITLPFIMPSFNVNFILSLIGGLKVFEQVYILTNGGPGNRTQVVNTWIFKMFGYGSWGMGIALNIILTLFISLIVLLSISILRKKEVEI